jgi:hypothetical protein
MISLFPKIRMNVNNTIHQLDGDSLIVREYHAVIPFDGSRPIWFERIGASMDLIHFTEADTANVWDSNVAIHTMDPITAVLLKLVTPEQVKMPAGIAGLLALMKPV